MKKDVIPEDADHDQLEELKDLSRSWRLYNHIHEQPFPLSMVFGGWNEEIAIRHHKCLEEKTPL